MSEYLRQGDRDFYRRAARSGATLLDEKSPGWTDKIDFSKLVMHSCAQCVLGQIYGHMEDGAESLGINVDRSSDLGFDRIDRSDIRNNLDIRRWHYEALRAEWVTLIQDRRRQPESK